MQLTHLQPKGRVTMTAPFVTTMNQLGKARRPFLFILDFDLKRPIILPLDEVDSGELLFDINGFKNSSTPLPQAESPLWFEKQPISFEQYHTAFAQVQAALRFGDSYLVNLTFPTKIKTNWTLRDIFAASNAKYKLWLKNQVVVFSPEIFVKIENGIISSNPMKGTIDAGIPNARKLLLNNFKEIAEHNTIVDLIRNDLNLVGTKTHVEKFRYIDHIQTNGKDLLQVSSKITAELAPNYHENIGTIFQKLLPAGSITGAPKSKTVEIIKAAELDNRNFYTGILGIFDGQNVDSGVMIRYIEQSNEDFFFRSGGGITVHSNAEEEYQELIDKVYVPIARKYPYSKPTNSKSSFSSSST